MKPIKFLPLLFLGLLLLKLDSSACEEKGNKKDSQKKKTETLARSAYKALKSTATQKVDLHPDFMIGNSMLRF